MLADQPDRKTGLVKGRSDLIDAYAAALVALFGRAAGLPKHDAFGGRPPVEYETLYEVGT